MGKLSRQHVLRLWKKAEAVCFDVDCTVTKQDALDDLAEFLGCSEEVRELTNATSQGEINVDDDLEKRLEIMNVTVDKLKSYVKSNPAAARLTPGIERLITELQARNVEVFFLSGGFRELILPLADALGISRQNIFANRLEYMADDELGSTGTIRVLRGFDRNSRGGGKPEAIRKIREMRPFQTVVMVGDGITDLEAVEETGGADLFVGYGGVIERKIVKEKADWYITSHDELCDALDRLKVAVVGSGAWACAATQMISLNCRTNPLFQKRVDMWVYEEEYNGEKLSDKMNELHENPKYMPGVQYGDNVVANPDVVDTVKDADLIVLCLPHQFIHNICKQIQLVVKPTAFAVSLIKGIHIAVDGPKLISTMVRHMLGIECSVLMGANLAHEVKPGGLCEATVASHFREQGDLFQKLFQAPYFDVHVVNDVEGAELAGALKNVVALAAGFSDGCELGQNAKAAILREGLEEMRSFSKAMFPTVRDETFFESCGVADLIATCYGGRNHKIAIMFAQGQGSFEVLERDVLKGQKLQGVLTSNEVQVVLEQKGWEKNFPLFTAVNAIARGLFPAKDIAMYRSITDSPVVRRESLTRSQRHLTMLETTAGL